MSAWKEWLKTITALVIVLGVLETILPDNELRKFAKLVLGLVLMTAVLQPLLTVVYLNWDLGDWEAEIERGSNEAWQGIASRLETKGSEPVFRSLDQSLVHQVEAIVLGMYDVEQVEVQLKKTGSELVEVVVSVDSPDGAILEKVKRVVAHYLNMDEETITVIRREPWLMY
ncbi:MAG: stage III sporulation protein AF [Firmicutes bacterium]|nr:stage III sporulation protein AF [Bacillota bacterium]